MEVFGIQILYRVNREDGEDLCDQDNAHVELYNPRESTMTSCVEAKKKCATQAKERGPCNVAEENKKYYKLLLFVPCPHKY